MRGVWFEEYERLLDEADESGNRNASPSHEQVNEAVSERFARMADRYRDAQKYEGHE